MKPCAAALVALGALLAGCNAQTPSAVVSTTAMAPSAPPPVVVTWRPVDKTSEFLSAWRPKE